MTRDRFLNYGVETVGSTSEELAAVVRLEMTHLGKLIKDKNIRSD